MKDIAAAFLIALATTSCIHRAISGDVDELAASAAPEIDPEAPAAPPVPEGQAGSSNTGSDRPAVVDAMPQPQEDEAPTQATRDYSEAFNENPDYKPGTQKGPGTQEPPVAAAGTSPKARGTGSQRMMIKVDRINIRTSPDRHSKIVTELRQGDIVLVDIDENIGWAKIADGEFVRARHLKSAEN